MRFEELTQIGRFDEALALWRGPAMADVAALPGVRVEAERLEELRLRAVEERLEQDIGRGRGGGVVADLQRLVVAHPLRERLHRLLMLALYQSGRQGDALAAYREARRILADELGIEPGPELKELERRVLSQDAAPGVRGKAQDRQALPTGTVTLLCSDVETSTGHLRFMLVDGHSG